MQPVVTRIFVDFSSFTCSCHATRNLPSFDIRSSISYVIPLAVAPILPLDTHLFNILHNLFALFFCVGPASVLDNAHAFRSINLNSQGITHHSPIVVHLLRRSLPRRNNRHLRQRSPFHFFFIFTLSESCHRQAPKSAQLCRQPVSCIMRCPSNGRFACRFRKQKTAASRDMSNVTRMVFTTFKNDARRMLLKMA